MFNRPRFPLVAASLALCAVTMTGPRAEAQDLNGSIVGTVKDPAGAIVPGAKIVVTNVGTSAATTATALTDGTFTVKVPPGIYNINISAEGFKAVQIQALRVEINGQSRADAALTIGETSEVVNVAAISNTVDTTTSTLKETVSEATIQEAPLNGRNPLQLILLVPGVVRDPRASVTSGNTYPGASGISINGNRSNTTNYILDGSSNNDNYVNAPAPMPNPDALQEFSVQTNNFGAEFGRLPGGVVNAVTKSGTNQLHGSAFEYIRNNMFNAANHFSAVTNGVKSDDGLKRHQFGGTLGGPVLLPHLYNGRDKTFFFFSLQETLVHQRPNSSSAIVPSAALRAGDFSAVTNPLYIPFDPARGTYANKQIPLISPVAQAILKFVPVAPAGTPVNAQGGQTVYFKGLNNTSDLQLLARIDQHFGSKNTLSGSFFRSEQNAQGFLDPGNYLALKNAGNWIYQRYQANDTHIFSASLLNQASFAYLHNYYKNTPVYPSQTLPALGANIYVPPGQTEYIFSVSNFFGMATGDTNAFIRDEYQGIDTVRWNLARHSLSFGGEYYFGTGDNINNFQQNPTYTFAAQSYTPNPNTVAASTTNSFADFLLGRFSTFLQGAGEYKNTRYNHWAAFAEDSWKVNTKLVLNFGARYEPFLPYYDLNNKLAVWSPGTHSTLYPNAPVGVLFVGDPGVPHGGFAATYTNFAPRVGFAYDVFGNGKTSLRGGYGIFYDQPNTITTNNQTDQAPFAPVITLTSSAANSTENPYAGTTSPFPYPTPPSSNATFPQYTTQYVYSQRMRNAYTQSFNLQLQQDLGKGTIFSIAYAGSEASKLPIARELNAAVYTPGSSSTANTNQRRPYAPAMGASTILEPAGSAHYGSLQTNVRHTFSHGISLLANYTLGHAVDSWSDTKTLSSARAIPTNSRYDIGPADFDRRNVLNVTSIVRLPSPRGNAIARTVLGGWQHTMIFNYTSGYPFSILSGQDNALTGTPNQRANLVPGAVVSLGKRSTAATQAKAFNTAAFTQPTLGTQGNTGRNSVRGPAFTNVDMGMLKEFGIAEHVKMAFRFEAFNVFNHTNLSTPTNTLSSGNFGLITSAYDPRILQFALRLSF